MQRLTKKKDYDRLREVKQKKICRYFIVVYLNDETIEKTAVGITVSKKVGNAVARNKVKRRIKAVTTHYKTENDNPNTIANIIALPAALNTQWLDFKKELTRCLDKVFDKNEKQNKWQNYSAECQ